MAEWITRAEAAERAGVHRNTVIDFERRGLVKTRREAGPSGQRVMVDVASLDRVIAARPAEKNRSSVAALEAELAACREQLEEVKQERTALLQELVSIARGRRR